MRRFPEINRTANWGIKDPMEKQTDLCTVLNHFILLFRAESCLLGRCFGSFGRRHELAHFLAFLFVVLLVFLFVFVTTAPRQGRC